MASQENVRTFEYTDAKGKTTTREALFYRLPAENLKAIDITELDDKERAVLKDKYDRYQKFLENVRAPSFEDWMLQTDEEIDFELKHRTFNIKRIRLLG